MRQKIVARLEDAIAGTDRLSASTRDELYWRLSTRPAYTRFLRRTKGGKLRIDRTAIADDDAKLDGKYLLRTSDPTLSAEDVRWATSSCRSSSSRMFREGGGMPTIRFNEPTGRYLSFAERDGIAMLRTQEAGIREIARRLDRSASTISRELRRNAATRGGKLEYRATVAQWHRDRRAAGPKPSNLATNDRLHPY